jgi:RNA polymerase sigma-70 factor (ECF subfamily)
VSQATSPGRVGFEEEALPHLDAVYRFALRLAGTPDQAEDLVQETFLRAYGAWDQYTPGTKAKSWLFTICRNVFLRGRDRARRHDRIVEETAGGDRAGPSSVSPVWASVDGVDPEGDFFGAIVDEEIVRAIEELPDEFGMVIVLSDLEGLAYAEIAELLEMPVGTVKSRLFRGRRRLQERLYDYAVEMGYISPRIAVEDRS